MISEINVKKPDVELFHCAEDRVISAATGSFIRTATSDPPSCPPCLTKEICRPPSLVRCSIHRRRTVRRWFHLPLVQTGSHRIVQGWPTRHTRLVGYLPLGIRMGVVGAGSMDRVNKMNGRHDSDGGLTSKLLSCTCWDRSLVCRLISYAA